MALHCPAAVNEDRIVAPAHAVRADVSAEPAETLYHQIFVRHVRLNIFAVGRDRHKPVLPERPEQIHMFQHGRRILCTENDQVHDGRVDPIPGHRDRIKRIADHHIPLPDPVCQPCGIKSREIGSVSGL